MKKITAVILPLALTLSLCACGGGKGGAKEDRAAPETEASETAVPETETPETEASGDSVADISLPLDEGGLVGVYKDTGMAEIGMEAYLIVWDNGIAMYDMLGTMTPIAYDAETFFSTGEGAVPQSYTYADGVLTWSYTDDDGKHDTVFAKLTADELATYEANGTSAA